ncbi:hypothetical protein GCK32_013805 [Trichostrongylus colubriformis]|uniref:Uncharacterized protein n=1 Tax=Trichostrongylus colubriformis TaxID=6319 RepID=A0AAN8G5B5_TRICO
MVAKPYCTVLIVLCFVCHCTTDVAFDGFCSSPPHFGNGMREGSQCTVTYDFKSTAASEAVQLCARAAPYVIKKATFGERTTCIYENSNITCRTTETAIGNRCFVIEGYGDYSNFSMQCGWVFVQPHVIENEFEREWISGESQKQRAFVIKRKN